VRARRVAEREGADWRAVLEENRNRHGSDAKRYKTIYGYDLADTGVYDIVLSTDDRTPEALVQELVSAAQQRFDGSATPERHPAGDHQMTSAEELVGRVRAYHSGADAGLIRRAYEFSRDVHRGQKRQSGDPYFVHPVGVACLIAELKLDVPSVVTGLLHDTVEDTLTTLDQIRSEFGEEIAALVDGVTKISQVNFTSREEKQAENFRKMVLAMARDIRVILVKLADRTDNMRTLSHLAPDRQREIAQETLDIYAPIAHRSAYRGSRTSSRTTRCATCARRSTTNSSANVAKKKAERGRYINEFSSVLTKKAGRGGIEAEVAGRPKHFYSIYGKMQRENLLYDQIYDLVGFRVIVDTLTECYGAARGRARQLEAGAGRFKDYIALPRTTCTSHCTPPSSVCTGSASRCRSARTRCIASPSSASPRTGSTRAGRRWGPSKHSASPGCANCWNGSRMSPTRRSSSAR
jgi:hypothetical protein